MLGASDSLANLLLMHRHLVVEDLTLQPPKLRGACALTCPHLHTLIPHPILRTGEAHVARRALRVQEDGGVLLDLQRPC